MESITVVTIKKVVRKVSSLQNVYHEIDLLEETNPNNEENEIITTEWLKLYSPMALSQPDIEKMLGEKRKVTFAFFPTKRTVGDKTFINVQVIIKDIQEV